MPKGKLKAGQVPIDRAQLAEAWKDREIVTVEHLVIHRAARMGGSNKHSEPIWYDDAINKRVRLLNAKLKVREQEKRDAEREFNKAKAFECNLEVLVLQGKINELESLKDEIKRNRANRS